jgi:hypothetical protein
MDDQFIQRKMDEFPIVAFGDSKCFQLSIKFIDYLYVTRHYLDVYRNNKTVIIDYDGIYYKIGDFFNLREVLQEIDLNVENIHVDDIYASYLDKNLIAIDKVKLDITIILNENTTK